MRRRFIVQEMVKQIIREEMYRSMKKYHFISGLPASGQNILAKILAQNPQMYASNSSPIIDLMITTEQALNNNQLFAAYPDQQAGFRLVSSIITTNYKELQETIVFDRNMLWPAFTHYIAGYVGEEPKVLCMVRNLAEVLASMLAYAKASGDKSIDNALEATGVPVENITDDMRAAFLSQAGIVGFAYSNLKTGVLSDKYKGLYFIDYNNLMQDPKAVLAGVYEFLGYPYYEHDYSIIDEYFAEIGDDLDSKNDVHEKHIDPKSVLSENILTAVAGAEFWKDVEAFREAQNTEAPNWNSDSEPDEFADSDTKLIG